MSNKTKNRFFIYEVHRCKEKGCGGTCDRHEPSCKSDMSWKIDIEFPGSAAEFLDFLKKNRIKIISQDTASPKRRRSQRISENRKVLI